MQTPTILLPKPQNLFQHRASRFRELANTKTSLAGYLNLMAELADCQHSLSERFLDTQQPDSLTTPPLDISNRKRDIAWHDAVRGIAEGFKAKAEPIASVINQIQHANSDEWETWADGLLAGELESLKPGLAPFIAAALQVYWAGLAARLDVAKIRPLQTAYLCPVCGSLPVGGVLQTGGAVQGLRYLCCGLCASEWNRPRLQCVYCGSSKEVAYYGINGAGEGIKAEACASCKTYIKLMNREKDVGLEPIADDLATLSLDILMSDAGYQRLGFNLLFLPG